jgi:hypothetical protein
LISSAGRASAPRGVPLIAIKRIPAIDQQTANVRGAHLGESDFMAGSRGHD